MDPVIETHSLAKNYRFKNAVSSLDLRLMPARACAFLGRNGAGKTTTIKMLAGLIRPSGGSSFLSGRDSQKLRPADWQHIGYVSENQKLYGWMTARQLITYTAALYPEWDADFERNLIEQLDIPLDRRISRCSRGEKVKLALLLAMAYRPRLLILDEPFAGLDALTRAEFLDTLLEITNQHDWSVFFSTHDIDDVEKLADDIAIIDNGRLQICEPLETLQARHRTIDVIGEHEEISESDSAIGLKRTGNHSRFTHTAFDHGTQSTLRAQYPAAEVTVTPLSLKEIFLVIAKSFKTNGKR